MDSDVTLILIVIVMMVSACFGSAIGKSARNQGEYGFVLGLFLGPLGCLIVLLLPHYDKCPHCRSGVPSGATVCRHCTRELK
jgi:hypothetical protein